MIKQAFSNSKPANRFPVHLEDAPTHQPEAPTSSKAQFPPEENNQDLDSDYEDLSSSNDTSLDEDVTGFKFQDARTRG